VSFIDGTRYIEKFTGTIIYVTKAGNDANTGLRPATAMLTIAAAETAAGANGKIIVGPGTYTENVTLSEIGTELWGEVGTIMAGTLTMGANSQRVVGMIIQPTGAVGIDLNGAYCKINDTNVVGTPTIGFDIDGAFNIISDCKVAGHTVTAFDIATANVHLYRCAGHGAKAGTRGFYLSNLAADTVYLEGCSSVANDTAGYEIVAGCTYVEIKDCSSGGGDGERVDAGTQTVWSNYSPPQHQRLFGGAIWYVNKGTGDDNNSGFSPSAPFETIGAAISASSAGDAINVKAGTYTETGLNMNKAALELWCEIGTLIDPASGTCLTVSGASCRISGDLKITPDVGAEIGLLVTGAECVIEGVKVLFGTDNFRITGSGVILKRCASGFPSSGNAAYDIQGAQGRYINCNTVGNTTSYGFQINNGADTGVLENCTSTGNATAGFYIGTGSQDWTVLNCSSGADDGRWVDVDHANVWSNFSYAEELHNVTTFAGVPTAYNIFQLTGSVRISDIWGTVETVIPNTASRIYLQLYSTNGTVDMTDAPGVDIDSAVAGALLVRNAPSSDPLDLADPDSTPAMAENTSWKDPKTAIDIIKDDAATTYVRLVLSAALASGAIDWHCKWEPLSDDGYLKAV